MNEYVEKLRSIYHFYGFQIDPPALPSWRMGQTEQLISYFSNTGKRRDEGIFDDDRRKRMVKWLQADAESSLYCAHKADLEAIANLLDTSPQ